MHKPMSRRTFILDGLRGAAGSAMPPVLPRLRASPRVARSIPRGPDDFRQLESLIPELMGQSAVPGVSIAIIKDATVAWHRGSGVRDARSRAPVDQHTVFEAASVKKTVFADAALRFCDRGTLSLDRPPALGFGPAAAVGPANQLDSRLSEDPALQRVMTSYRTARTGTRAPDLRHPRTRVARSAA